VLADAAYASGALGVKYEDIQTRAQFIGKSQRRQGDGETSKKWREEWAHDSFRSHLATRKAILSLSSLFLSIQFIRVSWGESFCVFVYHVFPTHAAGSCSHTIRVGAGNFAVSPPPFSHLFPLQAASFCQKSYELKKSFPLRQIEKPLPLLRFLPLDVGSDGKAL